ncbi:MAG: hypothetical protein AMXMBFR58_28270 [Phycisphaerae bacterium]
MVLGNNWCNVASYEDCLRLRAERLNDPTFRGLLKLLRAADVDPANCFFTNVYMGLLDHASSLASFPEDAGFQARCVAFLMEQIHVVKPRTILALGTEPMAALAKVLPPLRAWLGARGGSRSFAEIDRANSGVVRVAVDGAAIVCVGLTHPSMTNSRLRKFGDKHGAAAEVAMVREAVSSPPSGPGCRGRG